MAFKSVVNKYVHLKGLNSQLINVVYATVNRKTFFFDEGFKTTGMLLLSYHEKNINR
jgi:hypothetical protein